MPVHIRIRTGWNARIPLGYPVHLPGKVGHGGVHRAGGALIALLVLPMLAQDPDPGLVHILLRRLEHVSLRLEELLTEDLPGMLRSTGLEGLLLAHIWYKGLLRHNLLLRLYLLPGLRNCRWGERYWSWSWGWWGTKAYPDTLPHGVELHFMDLVTEERLLADLPGLLHSTGLEGLLLALVSRRNLNRLRSWSRSRNRFWSQSWDCSVNSN